VFVLLKYTSLSAYSLVIGNVTFAMVVCILNWLAIEKYVVYKQEILKTFIIPFVSAGLMGVAGYLTYEGVNIWSGSNAVATLAAIVNSVIIYFALLIFMKGVEDQELESLPGPLTRILQKLHML
jgi:stage V sporulation protein B